VSKTPHRRRYTLGNRLGKLARPNPRTPRDRADLVRIDLPRTTGIKDFVCDDAYTDNNGRFPAPHMAPVLALGYHDAY